MASFLVKLTVSVVLVTLFITVDQCHYKGALAELCMEAVNFYRLIIARPETSLKFLTVHGSCVT